MRRLRRTHLLLALVCSVPLCILVFFFAIPLAAPLLHGSTPTYLFEPGFCDTDHKNIIFVGKGDGGSDLYEWDAQTKQSHLLLKTPFAESAPDVSPNGHWLVCEYFDFHFPGSSGLLLVDPQSKSYQRLPASGARTPAFSPDGKRIAFVRFSPSALRNGIGGEVFEMDLATQQEKQLTNGGYDNLRHVTYLSNKEICFSAQGVWFVTQIGQVPKKLMGDTVSYKTPLQSTVSLQKWSSLSIGMGDMKLAKRRQEILFPSVDWNKNLVAACGYSLTDGKIRTYFGVPR